MSLARACVTGLPLTTRFEAPADCWRAPANGKRLARAQAVRSIHHHTCSRLRTAVKNRLLSLGQGHLHRLHLRDLTPLPSSLMTHTKRTMQAALDGSRRDHQRVGPVFQHQVNVDELVGKQDRILVVEDSLQFVGAGGGVDLVVGGEQVAGGQLLHVAAVVGVHGHALVGREALEHLGQLVLRQREVDGDGLELVDDHEIGGIR